MKPVKSIEKMAKARMRVRFVAVRRRSVGSTLVKEFEAALTATVAWPFASKKKERCARLQTRSNQAVVCDNKLKSPSI